MALETFLKKSVVFWNGILIYHIIPTELLIVSSKLLKFILVHYDIFGTVPCPSQVTFPPPLALFDLALLALPSDHILSQIALSKIHHHHPVALKH